MQPTWNELTKEGKIAAIKDYVETLFLAQNWYNIGEVKGLFLSNLLTALDNDVYNAPAYPSPILTDIVVWWNEAGRKGEK